MASAPQEDLVQTGLENYTDNNLYGAIQIWKKVIALAPNSSQGKMAASYLAIAQVELDSLKGKIKTSTTINTDKSTAPAQLDKQKDLLQQGLRYYTDNDFYHAIATWTSCVRISKTTSFGKQADGYITIAKEELKGLTTK